MTQLFTLLPKNLLHCQKPLHHYLQVIKIDDAEAWNISYQQSSGFSLKLETTPLKEYFRAINLTLSEVITDTPGLTQFI